VAAGQDLRLIDVSADMGAGLGIWNYLDKGETAAARSEALKLAAKAHFGHAGPLFLEKLIANREALLKRAEVHRKISIGSVAASSANRKADLATPS
jgi:putative DNA primase/helicase